MVEGLALLFNRRSDIGFEQQPREPRAIPSLEALIHPLNTPEANDNASWTPYFKEHCIPIPTDNLEEGYLKTVVVGRLGEAIRQAETLLQLKIEGEDFYTRVCKLHKQLGAMRCIPEFMLFRGQNPRACASYPPLCVELVRIFFAHGCPLDAQTFHQALAFASSGPFSADDPVPLEVLSLCVKLGAKPDTSILHYAIEQHNPPERISLLLRYGAVADVKALNKALYWNSNIETIELLLEAGVVPNEESQLLVHSHYDFKEIVPLFLKHGVQFSDAFNEHAKSGGRLNKLCNLSR